MAIGQRYYTPEPFEIDANGVPLAAAQLFFFATGTNTPQATYSDVGLTTPNANPVIADANGRFGAIWLLTTNAYAVQLWTAATPDNPTGSQVWAQDPVGPASGGAVSDVAGIVGEIRAYAGLVSTIPAKWYACFGQAVSRTTYSVAFAAMGTSWGIGDGTTTFNLPDLRGRALAGLDNMGGSAANRMTSGVSGIAGTTLGASGGNQAVQTHDHALTDPTHNHGLTDPGHLHDYIPIVDGGTGSVAGGRAGPPAPPEQTETSVTGITLDAASTGVSIANYGAGSSQNVQPTAMVNMIIYLGV